MSKAPEKPAPSAEVAPVGKSKKKLIIIALAALVLLAAVGGGAILFLSKKNNSGTDNEHKAEIVKPAVFVPIEPFTVNLQTDADSSDKYLQVSMTLQVQDDEQVSLIKSNMAQVRSRILMLLSSKAAIELTSSEGKELLIEEIVDQLNVPFVPKGEPQKVSSVFFTAFIIQ